MVDNGEPCSQKVVINYFRIGIPRIVLTEVDQPALKVFLVDQPGVLSALLLQVANPFSIAGGTLQVLAAGVVAGRRCAQMNNRLEGYVKAIPLKDRVLCR